MNDSRNDKTADRFLLLVTWRRERGETDNPGSVWRGSVQRLTDGGPSAAPLWFGDLDDIGAVIRKLLPEAVTLRNDDLKSKH
jgi:hypothetical protein